MESIGNTTSISNWHSALSKHSVMQGLGVVGCFLLLAFTWLPNSYLYMVGWPYALVWQSAFLFIGICTVWLSRKFKIPFSRLGYGLDYVVAFTVLVTAFSTVTARFPTVACWNLLLVINYAVFLYLLVNWLRSGTIHRYLLWIVLVVTGVVTSIVGLALWRPSADMWLSENFNSAVRNAQPLGHHNFVGGYELLLFPIVLGLALAQKGWLKWIGLLASTIVAIALYVSGSRGALFGLLGLGLFSIGLGFVFSNRNYRRGWVIVSCGFALFMSLALVSNPRVRTLFSTDTAPIPESTASVVSIADGPVKDRLFMISSTYNILKERPLLGVGPGNLSRVYDTFRPIEVGTGANLVQQVHNTPAQLAAELGILGLIAYASLLVFFIRLIACLHRCIDKVGDRLMLYSIGGSWFGYIISSLSDYQLENIGISSTLVATTALLISLADTYKPHTQSFDLSNRARRLTSMFLLIVLCTNLQFWAKADLGFYLSHSAIQDATASNLLSANEKLMKASRLAPWDPTYPALAAEIVLELMNSASSDDDVQTLRLLAIDYFTAAISAAPNDPWFNQNLASLLIDANKSRDAEPYIKETIRLLPRNRNSYTYYTLGLSLLKQNKISEAIEAFSLEALSNPIFMITNVWEQQPLLSVKDSVVNKTLGYYQQILSQTNEFSLQYRWLYEQWAIVSWWHDLPVSDQARQKLRPLAQAILISDTTPNEALNLVEEHLLSSNVRSNDMHLLQARLSPAQYLQELLDKIDGSAAEKLSFEESIRSGKTMKAWLNEVRALTKKQTRNVSAYAYRNLAANTLRSILHPGDIQSSTLTSSIGLFPDAPREYPQLDHFMADVRSQRLAMH